MQLRTIGYEELDAATAVDARAFRADPVKVRSGLDGNSRYSWRDVLAVDVDGEIAAMLVAFPMELWISGGPLKAAAIAAVAVPPEHRRRGLARFMLRETHARFRAEGYPVAILYPFAFNFYRYLGYEIAEWRHYYRVAPTGLPLYPERQAVRLARPRDWPSIHALHDGLLRRRGGLKRTAEVWQERFHGRDAELVVHESETGVDGYLQYKFRREEALDGYEVQVREMVAKTAAAERGLLGFLAAQQEQAQALQIVAAPDDPLGFRLTEPLSVRPQRFEFIMQPAYHGVAGMMLRVLDMSAALTTRRYPAGLDAEATVKVSDMETPEQDTWRIRWRGGRAEVAPTRMSAEVTTDIATMSAIFAGSLGALDALRMARVDGDEGAVALLDRAFAAPRFLVPVTDWF